MKRVHRFSRLIWSYVRTGAWSLLSTAQPWWRAHMGIEAMLTPLFGGDAVAQGLWEVLCKATLHLTFMRMHVSQPHSGFLWPLFQLWSSHKPSEATFLLSGTGRNEWVSGLWAPWDRGDVFWPCSPAPSSFFLYFLHSYMVCSRNLMHAYWVELSWKMKMEHANKILPNYTNLSK